MLLGVYDMKVGFHDCMQHGVLTSSDGICARNSTEKAGDKLRAKQRYQRLVSQTHDKATNRRKANKFSLYNTGGGHEYRAPGRPGRINCVRWRLISVDSASRPCFWRLKFCGDTYMFRKFMDSWYKRGQQRHTWEQLAESCQASPPFKTIRSNPKSVIFFEDYCVFSTIVCCRLLCVLDYCVL